MRSLAPVRRPGAAWIAPGDGPPADGGSSMSDVAYVVLTVALFAVLALALRGLERL